MILAFCSVPAAKLTLGRSVPSMVAKKSCVIGSEAELTRSCAISSHRANRCSTPCSRLHPAVCAICKPRSTENRSIWWRDSGLHRLPSCQHDHQREQTIVGKICILQNLVRLMKNFVGYQSHIFQVWSHCPELIVRDRKQNPILYALICCVCTLVGSRELNRLMGHKKTFLLDSRPRGKVRGRLRFFPGRLSL